MNSLHQIIQANLTTLTLSLHSYLYCTILFVLFLFLIRNFRKINWDEVDIYCKSNKLQIIPQYRGKLYINMVKNLKQGSEWVCATSAKQLEIIIYLCWLETASSAHRAFCMPNQHQLISPSTGEARVCFELPPPGLQAPCEVLKMPLKHINTTNKPCQIVSFRRAYFPPPATEREHMLSENTFIFSFSIHQAWIWTW